MSKYYKRMGLPFPEHLKNNINQMEDSPGVYVFFNKKNYPLYIGKSKQVRSRILSHFREFECNRRKTDLILQTDTIIHLPTAGEFTALFKEAELIKSFLPLYNKQLRRNRNYYTIKLNANDKVEFCQGIDLNELPNHYGIFSNIKTAKDKLAELAESTPICKHLCGLSATAPCFQSQLKRCNPTCVLPDFKNKHRQILEQYLSELRLKHWPYPQQALVIKETHAPSNRIQYLIIYQWCYLGIVDNLSEIETLLQQKTRRKFDKNFYRLSLAVIHQAHIENCLFFPVD